jgi:hypothetical protein
MAEYRYEVRRDKSRCQPAPRRRLAHQDKYRYRANKAPRQSRRSEFQGGRISSMVEPTFFGVSSNSALRPLALILSCQTGGQEFKSPTGSHTSLSQAALKGLSAVSSEVSPSRRNPHNYAFVLTAIDQVDGAKSWASFGPPPIPFIGRRETLILDRYKTRRTNAAADASKRSNVGNRCARSSMPNRSLQRETDS